MHDRNRKLLKQFLDTRGDPDAAIVPPQLANLVDGIESDIRRTTRDVTIERSVLAMLAEVFKRNPTPPVATNAAKATVPVPSVEHHIRPRN